MRNVHSLAMLLRVVISALDVLCIEGYEQCSVSVLRCRRFRKANMDAARADIILARETTVPLYYLLTRSETELSAYTD